MGGDFEQKAASKRTWTCSLYLAPPSRVVGIGRMDVDLKSDPFFFFFLIFIYLFIFIFGCIGSSFLCEGFLQSRQVGATLHRGARASHYRGLSCCGAQAPDAQAQ